MSPRDLLLGSFQAAVAAADPLRIVPPHLPAPPRGRTLVVGAGKAAGAMALAVEQNWPANAALDGLVITRYRHGLPTRRVRVIEAGHPVPDSRGEQAAREIFRQVVALGPDDLLLALISGGGSALLTLPADGVSVEDLRETTRKLLLSGAPIEDMNAVRKHLSAIQGGRLAAASRAPVVSLIISDVTGDEPTHVASGPCAPDPTTYSDALAILARYGVQAPPAVANHLARGAAGEIPETPKPGIDIFRRVENRVVAAARASLQAAGEYLRQRGFEPVELGDRVTGEARAVATTHAALALEISRHGRPCRPPAALVSGGETTVTVRGGGRGGRNAEYLLALAATLGNAANVHALACDTDGIDGSEDNAGAIITPDTLSRARAKGLDAARMLADNDAYGFFNALGDLVVTGPTRTNVNDYRAILIQP